MTTLKSTTIRANSAEVGRAKSVARVVDALIILGSPEARRILTEAAKDAARCAKRKLRLYDASTSPLPLSLPRLMAGLVESHRLPASAIERDGDFVTLNPADAATVAANLRILLSLNSTPPAPKRKVKRTRVPSARNPPPDPAMES